jgi:hypothetical protein
MIYQWKPEARVNLEAQVVGERLEHLRVAGGGMLTPEAVVDDARAADSPLHSAFEWDDTRAADEWRKEQARYLIRHVQVVIEEPKIEAKIVRAFVNVVDDEQEQGYTSIEAAMSEPELRRQVVDRAMREVREWRKRYSDLKELAGVFEAVDHLQV